VLILLMRIT